MKDTKLKLYEGLIELAYRVKKPPYTDIMAFNVDLLNRSYNERALTFGEYLLLCRHNILLCEKYIDNETE